MANTIIIKNSSTASAVPSAGSLTQGELAINVTDKKLFTKDSEGNVVQLGANEVTLDGVETLTNKTLTSPILNTATATGLKETKVAMDADDIDLATGNYFTKTISGATTLTVSNVAASGTANAFVLELTNGGSSTVTWFSGVTWAASTAPTLTASGVDTLAFFTTDGGTTWRGFVLGLGMG